MGSIEVTGIGDADHIAILVQQRPSAVAAMDIHIGLDILQFEIVGAKCANNAPGNGAA